MGNISFDLHKLGWKAFEDLVSCVFRDVMGQTLQSFAAGADGGRDAAFHGHWTLEGGETWSGSFTVQCKHTSKAGQALSASIVDGELPKIERLAKLGLVDNYIFVTNYETPAELAYDLERRIEGAGAGNAKIYGPNWIASIIESSPKLRRLVPRIYGLGDLTQIITHQAYRQSRQVLESMAPDLACFVPTAAYRRCAHALQEHGFVLLLGEPASGKTTIANLMALSAADEWNLQTLMLSSPEDFSRFWNPDDPGQFLWVDDAFGATQYDANRVREWNLLLPKLKSAIRSKARVVFTSRDYIFSAAKRDLKMSAFELFDDSRVTIRVEELAEIERQMIVYNHLKSGNQTTEFKREVKPFLVDASAVPKFLPEVARRFGNAKFTRRVYAAKDSVLSFFGKPVEWLQDVLSTLAPAESAAIALVFIAGGRLPIPLSITDNIERIITNMRSSVGDVKAALVSLDDSLLRRVREEQKEYWTFRHPTVRDAFASLVGSNPEFIEIYLAGVSTEQMLREVTCGDMGLAGVKIIIPPESFEVVLSRLRAPQPAPHLFYGDPVVTFLSSRCVPGFLEKYFAEHDINSLLPTGIWSIGSYNPLLQILRRMKAAGVLSEESRAAAAQRIVSLCEEAHSVRFTDVKVVGDLLTPEEVARQAKVIALGVLSDGDSIIEDIRESWDGEGDPEDSYSELKETLHFISRSEVFEEHEADDARSLLREIEYAVDRMREQEVSAPYEKLDTEAASTRVPVAGLGVFEDVDE